MSIITTEYRFNGVVIATSYREDLPFEDIDDTAVDATLQVGTVVTVESTTSRFATGRGAGAEFTSTKKMEIAGTVEIDGETWYRLRRVGSSSKGGQRRYRREWLTVA